MKKTLLVISLLSLTFINSCSYFRENYREVNFKMVDGTALPLIIFESTIPLTVRSLVVYVNDYPAKGAECQSLELKEFSGKLWADIVKQNDVSKLDFAQMRLLQKQTESTPTFCIQDFSKDSSGHWAMQ